MSTGNYRTNWLSLACHFSPNPQVKTPFQIAAKWLEIDENVSTACLIRHFLALNLCLELVYSFRQSPKWVNPDRTQSVGSLSSLITIVITIADLVKQNGKIAFLLIAMTCVDCCSLLLFIARWAALMTRKTVWPSITKFYMDIHTDPVFSHTRYWCNQLLPVDCKLVKYTS